VNVWVKRVVVGAFALAATAFAVEGGEYGTTDLYQQRVRKRALLAEVDSLQHEVDSLAQVKRLLQSDPRLQERIAREEFGMVRGEKELLYRFYDATAAADSAAVKSP
jgi:cell division protein FtsB